MRRCRVKPSFVVAWTSASNVSVRLVRACGESLESAHLPRCNISSMITWLAASPVRYARDLTKSTKNAMQKSPCFQGLKAEHQIGAVNSFGENRLQENAFGAIGPEPVFSTICITLENNGKIWLGWIAEKLYPWGKWRGDGDSNPGNALTFNGFQDRRIRPLCHLPGWAGFMRVAASRQVKSGEILPIRALQTFLEHLCALCCPPGGGTCPQAA